MSTPEQILERARRSGIRVEPRGEFLHVSAPKPPPAEILAALRAHKQALLRLLRTDTTQNVVQKADENAREAFEERAAVVEHDGGLSRLRAEALAARRVLEYQLTDFPGRWLLLLAAPGQSFDEAAASLAQRFGARRVAAVRAYRPGGNRSG